MASDSRLRADVQTLCERRFGAAMKYKIKCNAGAEGKTA
jgi:hypothetical protein